MARWGARTLGTGDGAEPDWRARVAARVRSLRERHGEVPGPESSPPWAWSGPVASPPSSRWRLPLAWQGVATQAVVAALVLLVAVGLGRVVPGSAAADALRWGLTSDTDWSAAVRQTEEWGPLAGWLASHPTLVAYVNRIVPTSTAPAASGSSGGTVAPTTGLAAPVDGRVTSGFGWVTDPTSQQETFHAGVQWSLPRGATVRAAAAGTVEAVFTTRSRGLLVVIAHDGGLETLYGGLTSAKVQVGAAVQQGQTIGQVTGAAGAHLYFEVWVNGNPVDPLRYLPATSGTVVGLPIA